MLVDSRIDASADGEAFICKDLEHRFVKVDVQSQCFEIGVSAFKVT